MEHEIIEAINMYYLQDEEMRTQIFLWLMKNSSAKMSLLCEEEIEFLGRCIDCGAKLDYEPIATTHNELDDCTIEINYEAYCPYCDFKLGEGDY